MLRRTALRRSLILITGVCAALHAGLVAGYEARRVVSLDYCADQYVLKLVDREHIAAVSMDADRDFSYMRDAADGLLQVRPSAENVLAMRPDLVVRSYGGGPNAAAFYRSLGLPVLQIAYTSSIEEVKQEILRVGEALDARADAAAIVIDMDTRLLKAAMARSSRSILYVTPGGVTSGPGSLVHELIEAAGLANFQTERGWQPLPLEKLSLQQPELLATAFYNSATNHRNFWSAARHPIIKDQLSQAHSITLDSATTACGGWFLVDAVEKLVAGAKS